MKSKIFMWTSALMIISLVAISIQNPEKDAQSPEETSNSSPQKVEEVFVVHQMNKPMEIRRTEPQQAKPSDSGISLDKIRRINQAEVKVEDLDPELPIEDAREEIASIEETIEREDLIERANRNELSEEEFIELRELIEKRSQLFSHIRQKRRDAYFAERR